MILKFQQGGSQLPPLATFNPVMVTEPAQAQATAAAAAAKSSGSDLTDKDLLTMLEKLEGLPSDMAVITNQLQNFYIYQAYGASLNTSNITSRYLSTLYQLKTANFNKKNYDSAFDIVSKNGGINEVAITDRGQLLCMNNNRDFKLISLQDLNKNEGYVPLTNAELLQMRAHNPELANNSAIIKVIQNGIGIETVTNMIKDSIESMGSSKNSEEGYVNTPSKKLIQGLRDFMQASKDAAMQGENFNENLDNLYHYKYLTEDQTEQAAAAFDYIYRTLPENAKTLLKVKTPNHTDKEAQQLVSQLISSKINRNVDFQLKMTNNSDDGSSKGSKSSKKSGFDLDPVSMLEAGYGEKKQILIQTGAGASNGISVPTVRMPIVKKDGSSIGSNSTLNDITESAFAGYLDFSNASMGDVMIPTEGFSNILVDGTALYTGYLPIDLMEYERSGNIRPDIAMLERYKMAQDRIKEEGITDPNDINKIYEEAQLPVMFDGEGNVLGSYIKFGIINANALSTAFSEDAEFSDYLTNVTDENLINNTVTALQKGRGEKDRIDFDEKSFFDFLPGMSYDRVYKGTIFIPVNQDHFTATAGTGKYPTTSEAEVIEAKQQALPREQAAKRNYVNPGTL